MGSHKSALRVVFAGTPVFAATILESLCETHHVVAVYTQPDRPAGRGRHAQQSAVKHAAQKRNLPVYQPEYLNGTAAESALEALEPDIIVVAAYGVLLPHTVLALPRLGCINVHASLLPQLRGASPIQYALLSGDKTTGITIMQMSEALDAGDILSQEPCNIDPADTAESVSYRLAHQGCHLLQATLSDLEYGRLMPTPQDHTQATYAPKLKKSMAQLHWQQSATALERAVRALYPWPIAYTLLNDHRLRILEATVLHLQQLPYEVGAATATATGCGMVLYSGKEGIDIMTGDGVLRLLSVQPEGSPVMSAADFLNGKGRGISVGMVCTPPPYAHSFQ